MSFYIFFHPTLVKRGWLSEKKCVCGGGGAFIDV